MSHTPRTLRSNQIIEAASPDICVIGAGVAGLMASQKLSENGFKVLVIEHRELLASGPSTRNEGWLHRGTYHATSICNRTTAIEVARRCIYGHDQITRFAPECIEDLDSESYALLKDSSRLSEILDRWDEANVVYQEVQPKHLKAALPSIDLRNVHAAFRVADVSINTRLLYGKILAQSERSGSVILANAIIEFAQDNTAVISLPDGTRFTIAPRLFIHASGFSVGNLFQARFGTDLPIRYWKSHLLLVPRLTKHGVFFLDPGESALMPHREVSIVGMNEDAVLCENPTYDTLEESVKELRQSLHRLIPRSASVEYRALACVKVDVAPVATDGRSLNVFIREPVPGHLCVLPGKMTEAPFLVDNLVRQVFDRLDNRRIAARPLDGWNPHS